MSRYFKITTYLFISFEVLFVTGIFDRGFVAPSIWTCLQILICLPYSICIIIGFIFVLSFTPNNIGPNTAYYTLALLNFYALTTSKKRKNNNLD